MNPIDIVAPIISMLVGAFWLVGVRRLPAVRQLLERPKSKPKVDAITDMTQWKRARRLEERQAWQKEFDLLSPPALTKRGELLARAVGLTAQPKDGATFAHFNSGPALLEWTSSGWVPVHVKKLHPMAETRIKWLLDAQERDQAAEKITRMRRI